MDGFINLLKPAGMTSHDVVFALRRLLRIKKIGHTGTLDPMAAGVLSMCVGVGTRAAEYVEAEEKEYRCELILGRQTDSGDIWGNPLPKEECCPEAVPEYITKQQVLEVLSSMQGAQQQYPPVYSAIRKNGKHLYEYARQGIAVEIEPRPIMIYEIRPVSVFHEPGRVMFDVRCSKGTYIRSICTEIGRKLGCGAAMSFLVRTASGSFRICDAVTLEELAAYIGDAEGIPPEDLYRIRRDTPLQCDLSPFLIPIDQRLEPFGILRLNDAEYKKYVNGGQLSPFHVQREKENTLPPENSFSGLFRVYGMDGRFAGTAVYDEKKKNYKASKVFFR